MTLPILHRIPVVGRSCGECTACCTVLGVRELEKKPWQNCQHICGNGCAIYAERPGSCKEFSCFWLSGDFGNEEMRPDKYGIIVDARGLREADLPYLAVREVEAGAFDRPKVKYWLNRLVTEVTLFLIGYGGDVDNAQIVGPRHDMEKIRTLYRKFAGRTGEILSHAMDK